MTSSAHVQIGRCRCETSQKTNLFSLRTGICPSLRPGPRVSSRTAAGDAVTLTAWQASQQFVQHPATTADPQLSRPSKPVTAYPPQQCYDAISSVEQTAANGCQGTCPPSGDGQAPTSQQHTVHQDTAQVNLPTHQQQEWQQDERQQREQQQWQQDEQQQQLQQHLERLLSNAEASTSSCAAAAAGDVYDTSTSPRSSTTRGTLTSHVRAQVEGSISSSHADNTTSVPVQRQQKVQVHPNSHATYVNHSSSSSSSITSSESSSNGTSSTKQVQGRQLVRPMQGMPSPGARPCPPLQLAELSQLLCISTTATQELLERCPKLQQQPTERVKATIQQLARELGISYPKAAGMAAQQPTVLLLRPASEAAAAAAALAAALGAPVAAVRESAVAVPSLLVRPIAVVQQRIHNICSWFAVTPAKALQMVEEAPELLTDSGSGLQRRLAAVRGIFRLQAVSAQRLAASFPSVLFMSPRIMNNKLRVLMAILQKDQVAVGKIVYKTPQLLRMNLERMRVCYQLLPLLLQRTESYVYAMMAHNGQLLLQPPAKLLLMGARLSAVLLLVPAWQQQWHHLRPPQVEEGFSMCHSRLDRLEYLVLTQQADSITFSDALFASASTFQQQFPSWAAWQAAVRHQRHRQRQHQQQRQQQQQKRQQRQPQVVQQTLEWQLQHGHLQLPVDRETHLDRLWVQLQEARQQQQHNQQQPESKAEVDAPSTCSASARHTAHPLVAPANNSIGTGSSMVGTSPDHIQQQQQQQQQCSTLLKSEYEYVVRQQLRRLQEQHRQRQRLWQHHRLLKQHQRVLQVQGLRQLKQRQQQQRQSATHSSTQHIEHYTQQHQQHIDHQDDYILSRHTQQQQQRHLVRAEAASPAHRTWPGLQVQSNLPHQLSVVQLQAVHHTRQHQQQHHHHPQHQQQHHRQWQKVGVQSEQQQQQQQSEPLPLHPGQQQRPSHYQHEQQQQHARDPRQVAVATNSLLPNCSVNHGHSSSSTHWSKSNNQGRRSNSSGGSTSMQQLDSHLQAPLQTASHTADVPGLDHPAHELQWHNQGWKQEQEQGQQHMQQQQQRGLLQLDQQQHLGLRRSGCAHQAFTANVPHQQQHTPDLEALAASSPVRITAAAAAANSSQRQGDGSSSSMQAPWHPQSNLSTGRHWMPPQQQQMLREEAVEQKVQVAENSSVPCKSHPGTLWRRRKQRQMQPDQQAADVWPSATVAAKLC